MISQAVFEILDVSPLNTTVNAISPIVVSQKTPFPYITYETSGEPEDNKDGFGIKHWEIQINIYGSKTKTGNAGVKESQDIGETVNGLMDRFSGVIGGSTIDTIILQQEDTFFDRIAETARTMITYRLREIIAGGYDSGFSNGYSI